MASAPAATCTCWTSTRARTAWSRRSTTTASSDGPFTLTIGPADGVGPDRAIGPTRDQDGGGATAYIAPDGKTVFAIYHDNGVDDHKIWSIDVASGEGHELSWPAPDNLTWQRLGS